MVSFDPANLFDESCPRLYEIKAKERHEKLAGRDKEREREREQWMEC